MRFESPEYLILLLLLIPFFLYIKKTKRVYFRDTDLLKNWIARDYWGYLLNISIILSYGFFIWYLSNISLEINNKVKNTFILDISYSMLAEDVWESRLSLSKKVIWNLALGNEFGQIITYARRTYSDTTLSVINEEYLRGKNKTHPGTATGDALLVGFKQSKKNDIKNIILLTDWAINNGIDVISTLEYFKKRGISIYAIWVASKNDTTVEIDTGLGYKIDKKVGWIDEPTLRKLALETGGAFFHLQNKDELTGLLEKIKNRQKDLHPDTINISMYLLYLGLIWGLFSIGLLFVFRYQSLWE